MDLAFLKYAVSCVRDAAGEGYRVTPEHYCSSDRFGVSPRTLEKATVEGDSPVSENAKLVWVLFLSTSGHV